MQQRDLVPEMDLEALIKLMRAFFQIITERVDDKPYAVRFIGSPFNTFVEDCRSIQVFTHNCGLKMSPHNIKAVLAKFEITEAAFLESLSAFENQMFLPDGSAGMPTGRAIKPN